MDSIQPPPMFVQEMVCVAQRTIAHVNEVSMVISARLLIAKIFHPTLQMFALDTVLVNRKIIVNAIVIIMVTCALFQNASMPVVVQTEESVSPQTLVRVNLPQLVNTAS